MNRAKESIVLKVKKQLWRRQIRDLESYLGVSDKLEDDLATVQDARMSGTCAWFSANEGYQKWKDFAPGVPNVLWVSGNPAAGKSVLSGYVVGQLQEMNTDYSYFFFKYGDKSKSRLSACLRSLAFQMAYANVQIRETILEMHRDDVKFDNNNERIIWRKLFLSGIFQADFPRHYCVIDALDECEDSASLFDLMLDNLDGSIPLRVFITSRGSPELEKRFSNLGTDRLYTKRIVTADTLSDIKFLCEAKAKSLVLKNDRDRADLVNKILEKSQGSFLWTVLVLNEMLNSHSEKEIIQVLNDVPRDMKPLYQRTLTSMSQVARGKKLSKAILVWTTCATRPLTTEQLDGALRLDVEDSFLNLKESIVALCGQLVTVDKFNNVQMVHETAREFLLADELESEFAINKTEAHTRIARACLLYLTGDEMRPPRISRRGSAMNTTGKRAEFSIYACAAFSYHLAKADPLAKDILALVDKFLELNVLSWIEIIAQTQNLVPLVRVAKNLRIYLNSSAAVWSPLTREVQTIRSWTTDFIRIAAKFADALITSPPAIYSLILPFCPTESAVYRTAGTGRRLTIVGLSNAQWDDRLSCIDYHQGQTSAICHGDSFFAVGLTTGTVALYHATSCQEYKLLNHGEAVKFLKFKSKTDLMASCGMKAIRIWDIRSGEVIYNFQAPHRPIGLAFDKNLLVVLSYKNHLASWDLDDDGAQQPDRPWNDSGEHTNTPSRRPPCAISISFGHRMLAVAYSGRPIVLWDLEETTYYGCCGKKLSNGDTSTHPVTALVFNPNPAISLLAVSYLDGELVLLDPFNDHELASFRAECHTLAASPDGRLLAGGAGSGTIQIYEFDTLRLLYRVRSSSFYIKQLAFSKDSFHFADIRGSQCNIWEPAVLLRDLLADDSSEATSTSIVEAIAPDTEAKISAITLHPKGEVVFCGKDDGSVCLYDLKTGAQLRRLYHHKSQVRILTWWSQSNVIMSVDASNGIIAWNLTKTQKEGWVTETILFQSRLNCGKSIIQVLHSEAACKFILSTRESDHLWSINGYEENTRTYSNKSVNRKWIQHQQSPLHIICIEGAAARIHTWNDWSEIKCVSFTADFTGLQLKSVAFYTTGHRRRMLLELSELNGSPDTRRLHLIDAVSLNVENNCPVETRSEAVLIGNGDPVFIKKKAIVVPVSTPIYGSQLDVLAHCVAHVINLSDVGRVVFLDNHSWVCSADLEGLGTSSISYTRHFFVPYDWLSGIRDVISTATQRDVLFARNGDFVIIKGGLDYSEMLTVGVKDFGTENTEGLLSVPAGRQVQNGNSV